MTLLKNVVVRSLLLTMLVCSVLLAGVITLGNYIQARCVDVNTARMNTLIEQGVKP